MTYSSAGMRFDIYKQTPLFMAGLSVAVALVSIATLNPYLVAFASCTALGALVACKGWGFIESWIFKHTNLVQLFGGFELCGSRDVVVARSGNGYTATSAAKLTSLGQTEVSRDRIENLIAHVGAPFKLIAHVEKVDVPRMLERLVTKRGMKEIELSRIERPSSGSGLAAAERLKAEIAYLEHEIASIKGGGIPLTLVYYMMTSAYSESRHKAEEEARLQARELTSEFDAIFGTKSSQLSGEDMVRILRFDSVIS